MTRAARVKSLFNAETGCRFDIEADLPADDTSWKIGVIVGPSGSGKSSLGRQFWPDTAITDLSANWPDNEPIVDAIAPAGDFNAVTGALAAVGLGNVPAWLRPFRVLSCGEQFRDGDRIAGGTVFWLSDTVDGGPVAAQDWCHVRPDDDASTL